jgi:glycosyltransferase involved in cell wall biosynthesis
MRLARVVGVVEPGGAQLAVLRLTSALRRRGIESAVYAGATTAAGGALFARHGVGLETWGGERDLQYGASDGFADWLAPRIADADVVHAHMFGAWWAAARCVRSGVALVGSEHNAVRWPGEPLLDAMRDALGRMDLFFACGPAARALVAELGLPPERLRTLISPIGRATSSPRSGLAVPRLVFAGRIHPEKGVDLLIEALARMAHPPPTYVVGSGPAERAVGWLARLRGLDATVRFVGWQDDPAAWIRGAAACVVPSRHEAWSQTAVLAMALGVPVVATAVEGLPTTLGEDRGVLVAPDDPDALARTLEDVIAGRRVPDFDAARAYARRFAIEPVADYYAAAYGELTGQAAGAAS